jgi:uncharacterized ion transporter superfamily protein YfcC
MPHAVVMMLWIIVGAVLFTYVVPSGAYRRSADGVVVPGTYHQIPKHYALRDILRGRSSSDEAAYPASPVAVFSTIPVGMQSTASLIFMILFIGGMFGVLQETGALNAGIERLLAWTHGNVDLLAPVLMVVISAGSTFLGLISEYLVIIPLMVVLAERLGFDALFGTAVVAIAAKIGYMTSVTNPLPLVIAQPIVGLPVFSGFVFRLVTWVVYLAVGIAFLLRYVRKRGYRPERAVHGCAAPLSRSHLAVMVLLILAIGVIVYGAGRLDWGNLELGAFYLFVAFAIALAARLPADRAATSFLTGVRGMVLAALLVGLARAVELILRDAKVLDTIIYALSRAAVGRHPVFVAQAMVLIQMAMDVMIPSTSGQAAVTMPILGPIGHLAGVSPQVSVSAFIFGNGLTNTITPTSGMLLAYLATGKVAYGTWVRFIFPLVLTLGALSLLAITVAVKIGI